MNGCAVLSGSAPDLAEALARDGFARIPKAFGEETLSILDRALARFAADVESARKQEDAAARRRGGDLYAIRHLLDRAPEVRAFAESPAVRELVEPILGPGAFPVRGLLFDKRPEANWKVPWHQDLTIAVRERPADPPAGFGPWSEKAGVVCVQPPVEILARMLTLRVHLDDCDEHNAPLRVIPGSHATGRRLDGADIQAWVERSEAVVCAVPRGGAVLMRPTILHASSASQTPKARRVIHLEFAADPLPAPLAWRVS